MRSLNKLYAVARVCILISAVAATAVAEAPKGWGMAGSAPEEYRFGTQEDAGFIAGIGSSPRGFGTLSQIFDAERYRGQRLRLSAEIRSEKIDDWAGMWLRIDGCSGEESLAFDNMRDRAIQGTTPWQPYEIVLDVPYEATAIAFGVILSGPGQVFFDNFSFESLGSTGQATAARRLAKEPSNLDFSLPEPTARGGR